MGWVATYIPAEIEIYEILGKLYSTHGGGCLIWQTSKSVGIISHFPVFPPTSSVKLLLICRQNERRRVREGEIREAEQIFFENSAPSLRQQTARAINTRRRKEPQEYFPLQTFCALMTLFGCKWCEEKTLPANKSLQISRVTSDICVPFSPQQEWDWQIGEMV